MARDDRQSTADQVGTPKIGLSHHSKRQATIHNETTRHIRRNFRLFEVTGPFEHG